MNKIEIEAKNVKKNFEQGSVCTEVLKGISAQFEQGKTYALTGVSGTGKSTLLHIIAGLDAPSSGEVLYDNKDIASLSPDQRTHFLNRYIGLVFQLPYLIRELSVLENVMLMGLIKGDPESECKKRALELLVSVGLEDKANHQPASLSGGQQQRVAILRALFNKPAFLLADEPTGNLDELSGKLIIELLLRYQNEWGMGIIVSSHDAYVAERMEIVYKLHDGVLDIRET